MYNNVADEVDAMLRRASLPLFARLICSDEVKIWKDLTRENIRQ